MEPLFIGIATVLTRSDSCVTEALLEIRQHANVTTTPKQRAYLQHSSRPAAELAVELGVSETTMRRWRARDTAQNHLHTPHRLATTLNPLQEFVVVELRKLLWLPPAFAPPANVHPRVSMCSIKRVPYTVSSTA